MNHTTVGVAAPVHTGPVDCAIDWGRRFDHMQQHTGQHVLSAALDKLFGVRTVSFHLGAAVSTIDLAREMSQAEIAAAETEANRIVWEDREVRIRYASAEEGAAMPLRKEPKRTGTLRLIDVDGFDLSGILSFDQALKRGWSWGHIESKTIRVVLGSANAGPLHWGTGRHLYYAVEYEGTCEDISHPTGGTGPSPFATCVPGHQSEVINAHTGQVLGAGGGTGP